MGWGQPQSDPAEAKVSICTDTQVPVRPSASQACLAWGHTGGSCQKARNTKRNRCVLGAKRRRASKEREEKAGRRARSRDAGPGDCIIAAPPLENGLRTAATIMALGSGRASRAPSPSARAAGTEPQTSVLQTFPPASGACPPTPSFLLCASVCM